MIGFLYFLYCMCTAPAHIGVAETCLAGKAGKSGSQSSAVVEIHFHWNGYALWGQNVVQVMLLRYNVLRLLGIKIIHAWNMAKRSRIKTILQINHCMHYEHAFLTKIGIFDGLNFFWIIFNRHLKIGNVWILFVLGFNLDCFRFDDFLVLSF